MIKKAGYIVIVIAMKLVFISASAQVAMPDTVCVGATKRYKVNDAFSSSTYTWKIDGVAQSTTKNEMIVTWTMPGKFLITVQEHTTDGCDGETQSGYVYVNASGNTRYPSVFAVANVPKQLSARDMGNNVKYNWSPTTGLNYTNIRMPIFKYDKPVQYLITISPANGCQVVDTLQVLVTSSAPGLRSSLHVPTAWSPNNDGVNDKLYPLIINVNKLYYFRVFNRWGQLVFETNKIGEGWDGTYKGQPQVQDVYTWTVEAKGLDGVQYKQSGNSVLLR